MLDKIKNTIIVIISLLTLASAGANLFLFNEVSELNASLTTKDLELQIFDKELGISKSKLFSSENLNKKYKEEIDKFPILLQQKIKNYELQLHSRDMTIAKLTKTINGGSTEVVVDPKNPDLPAEIGKDFIISYAWNDKSNRFRLVDPDIFIENNETFTYNQYLKVIGHVFYGKDGKLQIRKIELQEVIPDGQDSSGKQKYTLIDGGKLEIIDSEFDYTNISDSEKKSFLDIFKLRAIATYDTQLTPGLGIEFLNLGNLMDYANVGLNSHISADLSDPLNGSLGGSRIGVGANFSFLRPFIDTNFAIGASVSTPFNDLGGKYMLTLDGILYLTN